MSVTASLTSREADRCENVVCQQGCVSPSQTYSVLWLWTPVSKTGENSVPGFQEAEDLHLQTPDTKVLLELSGIS